MGDVIEMAGRVRSNEPRHILKCSFEVRPGGCTCADFVLGFEAGLLFARLSVLSAGGTWGGTYHATNRTMLERIAEATGCAVELTPADEDGQWLFADFSS